MLMRSFIPNVVVYLTYIGNQVKQIGRLLVPVGLLVLFWTMLILSEMAVARMNAVPAIPDLPEAYFPGKSLPTDIACQTPTEYIPRCFVNLNDHEIYVVVEKATRTIMSSSISAQEFSLGHLITAWGRPTGISPNEIFVDVYWGTRSVHIIARSLKPNSIVEFIRYNLLEQKGLPWQGFQNYS